jgi:hypothetical protein
VLREFTGNEVDVRASRLAFTSSKGIYHGTPGTARGTQPENLRTAHKDAKGAPGSGLWNLGLGFDFLLRFELFNELLKIEHELKRK